jgi:hypothetical protein
MDLWALEIFYRPLICSYRLEISIYSPSYKFIGFSTNAMNNRKKPASQITPASLSEKFHFHLSTSLILLIYPNLSIVSFNDSFYNRQTDSAATMFSVP